MLRKSLLTLLCATSCLSAATSQAQNINATRYRCPYVSETSTSGGHTQITALTTVNGITVHWVGSSYDDITIIDRFSEAYATAPAPSPFIECVYINTSGHGTIFMPKYGEYVTNHNFLCKSSNPDDCQFDLINR